MTAVEIIISILFIITVAFGSYNTGVKGGIEDMELEAIRLELGEYYVAKDKYDRDTRKFRYFSQTKPEAKEKK